MLLLPFKAPNVKLGPLAAPAKEMAGDEPELSPHGRPVWQANKESKACTKCGRPFTLYYRRHHCRGCGKLLCDTCSSHRMELPEMYGCGSGQLRVCTDCWDLAMSLQYEANLARGIVQPLDYGKVRQELEHTAQSYLSLPETGWVEQVDRGVKIGTQAVSWHPVFVVRSELIVKAPFEKTRSIYGDMDLWKNWNPYVMARIVEVVDENSKVFEATYEAPVIKNRSGVFFCVTRDRHLTNPTAQEATTTLAMSVEHPLCPQEKGTVRATIMFCMTSLESINNGRHTKLVSLVHSDPRGLLPPFVVNRFLARGADHLQGMCDYIETH